MSEKLELLMDAIIDGIISFKDFFIIRRHITLSEGTLFLLSFGRSIWFSIFGVALGPTPGPLVHEAWLPVFWLLTAGHFLSFLTPRIWFRVIAISAYAFIWCFLAILVGLTQFDSPALPTFGTFALLAVFISVRLMCDLKRNDADAEIYADANNACE